MKNSIFLFLSLLSVAVCGKAQFFEEGLPFITNYLPAETGGSEQNWAIIQDSRGLMYFGNNDKGVLEYDGSTWRSIPVTNNSIVRSLAMDQKGTIFVGAVGEFGFLKADQTGELKYISLSAGIDSSYKDFGDVWKIFAGDSTVYFCSADYTFIFYTGSEQFSILENRDGTFMSHLVNGSLFHSNLKEGLLIQTEEGQILAPGGIFFIRYYITFILPWKDQKLFVGTAANGGFLYDPATGNIDTKFINPEDNNFLRQNGLYHGILLSDEKLGLSTLYGGFLILDENGRIIQKLNKQAGLQDETVLHAFVDPKNPEQSPVWLALNIGISKVEINSPFRVFDEKSGLSGTINDIIRFKGTLYLATSSGVFYMDENRGMVDFKKVMPLNTQSWSFARIAGPDSRSERLLVTTIQGLHEIRDKVSSVFLDPMIANHSGERMYYLYTHCQSEKDSSILYIGGRSLITLKLEGNIISQVDERILPDEIRSIAEALNGDVWLATSVAGVARIQMSDFDTVITMYSEENGLPSQSDNFIYRLGDDLLFATEQGVYRFNSSTDTFYPDTLIGKALSHLQVYRMLSDRSGRIWISFADGKGYGEALLEKRKSGYEYLFHPFNRLPDLSTDVFYEDGEIVWMGKSSELYKYNDDYIKDYNKGFHTLIRSVSLGEDSILFYGTGQKIEMEPGSLPGYFQSDEQVPVVSFSNSDFIFKVSSAFFESEKETQYRYMLEGSENEWSKWSDRVDYQFYKLRPGEYIFHIQAKNIYNIISDTGSYQFSILHPWYQTFLAYTAYVILLVLLVILIVILYTRQLVNKNIALEAIIETRTAEIRRQKEELTDSIKYASRIQQALLPSRVILNEYYPENFIFFVPRDIVSGDFYWMTVVEGNKIIITAADCTGHGVPGAFMSMLGISFLNELVTKMEIVQPNKLLDELRSYVIKALKQTGEIEGETTDGMDMSICVMDSRTNKVQFAGAYNPLFIVRPLTEQEKSDIKRGKEPEISEGGLRSDHYILNQIRADRMPVGISVKRKQPFKMHEIELTKGHTLYLHSDGYQDQFGGSNDKKFTVKGFKKLLLEIQDEPMHRQKQILESRLLEWMDGKAQVDDIIVVGIRI